LEQHIPPVPDEEAQKAHSRELSIKQACFYGLTDGFGQRYITPFALAVGANNRVIGILASLPNLLGNLSQLFTLKLVGKWSRKKITMTAVNVQAIFWPLLIGAGALYFVLGVRGDFPPWSVLVIYTLMTVVGALCGPAWTTWMKDLMPKEIGAYMGRRSRNAGLVGFLSMMAAGFLLDRFKVTQHLFLGFVVLFAMALFGRLMSGYFISRQYEPSFKYDESAHFTFLQFIKRMSGNNFGRFAIYISLFSMTAQISSPFITVYMLKYLDFSYTEFTLVSLSSALTALIALPYWGRFSDRFGNLMAIRVTGLILPFIPMLWMLSPVFSHRSHGSVVAYLIILQAFSGLIWSGFEMGSGNFIFHAVTPQRIAICAAYFSILNGAGALIGGFLGGFISSLNFTFFGLSSILFIFLLSGSGRLFVFLFMNRKIREVRTVEMFTFDTAKSSFVNFLEMFKPNFLKRPGDQ
jgi:MFS family permease